MKKTLLLSTISFLLVGHLFATTWDEPWRKEILQTAEHFVFGKVIRSTDSIIHVQVQKNFGGVLSGIIQIDDFFMLDLCSISSIHSPEFLFEDNEEAYFFLKKGKNGNYQLPTPTSGVDRIVEGKVFSTYRHSYHQAALRPEIYEMTYIPIWNHYQQKKVDKKEVLVFIQRGLNQEVAGFEEDEIELFFEQHAALESAYHLEIALEPQLLNKFIESENFHAQVSGLRALGIINSTSSKAYLIEYIKKPEADNFNKVIAIWSILEFGNTKDKKKLWKLRKKLSDEDTGFGGSLMDPRVCTYFPSPKQAILNLKKRKRI